METRATHVKDEQRIFSRHDLRRAVVWDLDGFLVPPLVTSFGPGNSVPGPLEDKNVLDYGAILESGVNDSLGGDSLSTSAALVRGNQNTGLAILDAVSK